MEKEARNIDLQPLGAQQATKYQQLTGKEMAKLTPQQRKRLGISRQKFTTGSQRIFNQVSFSAFQVFLNYLQILRFPY